VLKKKYVIVAFLAVCLITTIFIGITTSGNGGKYDPWADIDGDGDVDADDVFTYLAPAYGTTGNPTRNVTVTNFPTQPEPKTIVVCQNYNVSLSETGYTPPFAIANVTGYRFVSVFVKYYIYGTCTVNLWCSPSCSNITSWSDGYGNIYGAQLVANVARKWTSLVCTGVEIGAPCISFCAWMPPTTIELTIILYCYN